MIGLGFKPNTFHYNDECSICELNVANIGRRWVSTLKDLQEQNVQLKRKVTVKVIRHGVFLRGMPANMTSLYLTVQ